MSNEPFSADWPSRTEVTRNAGRLRRIFNDMALDDRVERGEVSILVRQDRHSGSAPNRDDPPCTRAQFVYYVDNDGAPIAGAFRYLRPDGRIGGSGRPDPKIIRTPDGTLRWQP